MAVKIAKKCAGVVVIIVKIIKKNSVYIIYRIYEEL